MLRLLVITTACRVASAGNHPWVWGGLCEMSVGERYTWSATRGPDGAYVESEMKVMSVFVGEEEDIKAGAPTANASWDSGETPWTSKFSGDTCSLVSGATTNLTSFTFRFDESSWISLFHIEPSASGHWTFFTSQLVHDLENGFHFLRDEHGHDVECVVHHHDHAHEEAEDTEHNEEGQGLGVAIGAAALTALPALLMLPFVGPAVVRAGSAAFPVMNSFASGAIFAAAAFLLLPESTHLIGEGLDESGSHGLWGSSVMFGWLIGVLMHHIGDMFMGGKKDAQGLSEGSDATGVRKPVDLAVAAAVTCGDFVHNLVDGMVIGFAARACSSSVLWAVVAGGVAHEAPQEIADYIVLITKANLAWPKAMVLNVFAALPALVGAAIAYEAEVSDNLQGVLLAIGAGVYLFVAMTELAPFLLEIRSPFVLSSATRLGGFLIGATALGLVLLGHEHCHDHSGGELAEEHAHVH